MSNTNRRLARSFRPEVYDLYLNVFPETAIYKGKVKISGLKTGPPSRRLTFNQRGLKVNAATITRHIRQSDQLMTVIRINHHKSFGEVRLHTSEQLYNGNYIVTMDFNGKLTKGLKDKYPELSAPLNKPKIISDGVEKYLTGDLLPCIDEPGLTAVLNLTVTAS
jgi:aminopeptidase N